MPRAVKRNARATEPVWEVSPGGPLTDLHEALEASRQEGRKPRRLVIRAGTYQLTRPLILGPQDSGLTLEAKPGEEAVLSGGVRLGRWQRESGGLWSAEVPPEALGSEGFRLLVVNGQLRPRARFPEGGFLQHRSNFTVRWLGTTGGGWERKPTAKERASLRYDPADIPPEMDVSGAELTVFHSWDESLVSVARRDSHQARLYFTGPTGHPPGAYNQHKYVIWNVREGLTHPGQWYLDRSLGRVFYWPQPGEAMRATEAWVPVLQTLIRLEGTEEHAVREITLRGLKLTLTTTPLVPGGFGAYAFPGALALSYARDCRLENLEILHVGGQGIKADHAVGLTVSGCELHDLGACGLRVQGERVRLLDNRLYRVGRVYPSGIALSCSGQSCAIKGNYIHHTPYSGIAVNGDDHRLEGNHIHHVMRELCDGGAIYLGGSRRALLRGNYAHDIRDLRELEMYAHAASYYLDEQCEDCLVERNLSVRVERAYQSHMARRNTLRNNVFLSDTDLILRFLVSTEHRLEQSVLRAAGLVRIAEPQGLAAASDNLFFSESGEIVNAPKGTVIAEPSFVDLERGDYRFAPGSPARKLGIKPVMKA